MKTNTWRLLAVLTTVLLVGTLAPGDRGQVATDSAVVTSMYGDVQVRHGAGGYAAAKLNEVLKPGDAIKTGADSRAEINVGNGGYVRMDADSQILVTYIRSNGLTSFKAVVGGIWVTLENALGGASKFEVSMPSAVASVKGTVFRCEVGEDGESSTYVYEGEVEVSVGDQVTRVKPNEYARVPRGLKLALAQMNLTFDDEQPWVTYNRHRDIIRHLGNPSVMVALSERGIGTELGSYVASAALAAELRRHGVMGASMTPADDANFAIGADGLVKWREKPSEDYCIVGGLKIQQVRELREGVFAARVAGRGILVEDGDTTPIASVEAVLPGVGDSAAGAVADALKKLGERLGQEMAPRLLKELMAQRPGTLRVDISGGTREQIAGLRKLITSLDGVLRTTPLRLPGQRLSLAVAGGLDAEDLQNAIRTVASDMVQTMSAHNNVLYVRFKEAGNADGAQATPPAQGVRPQADNRPRPIKDRG